MFKIKKTNPKDYGKFAFIGIIVGLFLGSLQGNNPAILLFKPLGAFIFLIGIAYLIMAIIYKIKKGGEVTKNK